MPITPYSNKRKRQKSEAGNPRAVLLLIVLVVLAGGSVFLGTRDIPAPRHAIEKSIDHERFYK